MLRWLTEGAWVQNLPADFQWFGLGQSRGQWLIVALALALAIGFAWMLRTLSAGRTGIALNARRGVSSL